MCSYYTLLSSTLTKMCRQYRSGLLGLSAAAILLPLLACAPPRAAQPLLPDTPDLIALLPAGEGEAKLIVPQSGALANVGKGAALGSAAGAELGSHCGVGAILCIPIFGTVGALGGVVYGPSVATPPSRWDAFADQVRPALIELAPASLLRKKLTVRASEAGYLTSAISPAGNKPATIVEIGQPTISLEPAAVEINPLRRLSVYVPVRCFRNPGRTLVVERIFSDQHGPLLNDQEWVGKPPDFVAEEVQNSLDRLAPQIVVELFTLRDVPELTGPSRMVFYHGIRPLPPRSKAVEAEPTPTSTAPRQREKRRTPIWAAAVDTPTPTLAWEPFPFGKEVHYDVRVWRSPARKLIPSLQKFSEELNSLVFEREGLAETSVTVTSPLEARQWYYWSVRAHFREAGHEQVTPWAQVYVPPPMWTDITTLGLIRLLRTHKDATGYFLFSTAAIP